MSTKKAESLSIDALKQGRVTLRIIGTTPMYMNSMSAKAKRSLLIGGGKKTAAERKAIKHNPEEEYRSSMYRQVDGETLLCFPSPAFKCAMATAALETPGVTKTSVQRLIFLPQQKVNIWGRPQLKMDVVRSADMAKTPDVRTRAFLPRWCAEIDIAFVTPALSVHSIVSLLSNAGVICGIGDFRQEKGRGSYGTFAVSGTDMDQETQAIWDEITQEGRAAQQAALDNPEFADQDTADLMQIIEDERHIRQG